MILIMLSASCPTLTRAIIPLIWCIKAPLFSKNIETDIIPCDKTTDFSGYDMLVIPPLYVATDQLLLAIDEFVQSGGHVVMMHKSGYCNEHSAVRATLAPGPLRKACGFHYQESPLSVTYH